MKNKVILVSIILFLSAVVIFFMNKENSLKPVSKTYTIETFKIDDGWGYNILKQNKIFIKQKFIPAIHGNRPFVTKTDASNTAKLVIERLDKNKLPTITIKDLENINITIKN